MLEVAAVASYIIENFSLQNFDQQAVIEACLLHDMGNIIKFKDFHSEHMKLEEEYWRKVQKDFVKRYGLDTHDATIEIVKELSLINAKPILRILDSLRFHDLSLKGYENIEARICDFADMCVAPWGVVGFEERIADIINRYRYDNDNENIKLRRENAKKVQESTNADLTKITQVNFEPIISQLAEYEFASHSRI